MSKNTDQLQAYDLSPLKGGPLFSERTSGRISAVLGWVLVAAFLALLPLEGSTTTTKTGPPNDHPGLLLAVMATIGGVLALLIFQSVVWAEGLRLWLYRRALLHFQERNGLVSVAPHKLYEHIPPSIQIPGAYNQKASGYEFAVGTGQVLIFDYSFTVGSGKHKRDYRYGITCMTFTKKFPHLYLDGQPNGRGDASYKQNQQVDLEGDFNKYFKLYMPEGSAAGALTVLTPDVMQTLVDYGQPTDIEIQGYDVAAFTKGLAFTRETAHAFLQLSDALYKEVAHLETSWHPVYDADGKDFQLKSGARLAPLITMGIMIALYWILNFIFPHLFRR